MSDTQHVQTQVLTCELMFLHNAYINLRKPLKYYKISTMYLDYFFFFFQAEDGIRDQPRSRGLGDVYKRQDYRGIGGQIIKYGNVASMQPPVG